MKTLFIVLVVLVLQSCYTPEPEAKQEYIYAQLEYIKPVELGFNIYWQDLHKTRHLVFCRDTSGLQLKIGTWDIIPLDR